MAEESESTSTTTAAATKLLITSTDCDPAAELPFTDGSTVRLDAVVNALSGANYCFATRRRRTAAKVAILSLHASKKAAFFFLHGGDDSTEEHDYEISHDEMLMDDLPSHLNLKGLPRFHRFTLLPEELQLSVVRRLDGVGFASMRRVSRRFNRLRWDRDFDIMQYSRPGRRVHVEAEEWGWDNRVSLLGFASVVCAAAACALVDDDGDGDGDEHPKISSVDYGVYSKRKNLFIH